MTDLASTSQSLSPQITLTLTHHGQPHTFTLPANSTISTLSSAVTTSLSIPSDHQKFFITPQTGILRPPFPNPELPLSTLLTKKIVLLAPTPAQLAALSRPTNVHSPIPTATPARTRDPKKALADATYTFHTLLPLAHLPSPHKSLAYLERLRSDAGIRAAMVKHRFSVGVLTEMDPAEHTTHSSRTLGLNRNRGEAIELRLRTDAGDGYRDYGTIRKTLCHELAHNVHGEHDAQFWALTKQIEEEVRRGDWRHGGRALTDEVFFKPGEEEIDGGGWTGGEFVLGGGGGGKSELSGIGRREAAARAAEERARKQLEAGKAHINGEGKNGRTGI